MIRRYRRHVRAVGRLTTTLTFAIVLLVVAVLAGVTSAGRDGHKFNHDYPPNPLSFTRPKVTEAVPRAPRGSTLDGQLHVGSLPALASALPKGTLIRAGANHWRLTAPVDVTDAARITITGGELDLAPGSFLQARSGGAIVLEHVTVAAVASDGSPEPSPESSRGFLVARNGGKLVLRADEIRDLGHLGSVSYGISFREPAAGSAVIDSTVDGNYFGVFLSHAVGVAIVGNTVANSSIYGIDPYGGTRDGVISGNRIVRPGLHGIVLANGVTRMRIVNNHVVSPGAHGIVLFDGTFGNTIQGNVVTHAFDGIVVTDSSANRFVDNTVDGATRFGLRVSGASAQNTFTGNTITHALLGAYFYKGAYDSVLTNTVFMSDTENVRVRSDAGRTVINPTPANSELP